MFALGIASAGIVFWSGTRALDAADDPFSEQYAQSQARARARQMGLLFGQMGTLIDDLSSDLKRPGVQAALVAVLSVLAAQSCFYFARLADEDANAERPASPPDSPAANRT